MENLNKLAMLLRSTAQGANNSVAGAVTIPVDTLAYLLRKGGVPIPDNPIGGEQWMREMGLVADPEDHRAGAMGAALTMAIPTAVAKIKK